MYLDEVDAVMDDLGPPGLPNEELSLDYAVAVESLRRIDVPSEAETVHIRIVELAERSEAELNEYIQCDEDGGETWECGIPGLGLRDWVAEELEPLR